MSTTLLTSRHTPVGDLLTIVQASELRTSNGRRRYGSVNTLRRRLRSGELPYELRNGRYYVALADLDALIERTAVDRVHADLVTAARRAARLAPPMTAERRKVIVSILRGA